MRCAYSAGDRLVGGPARGWRRIYDVVVREALIVLWEASDRVCGKRLRPLVPLLLEAMERHGHLQLAPEVRGGLLSMSAATIDRALHEIRGQAGGALRRRAAASAGVRRSVPVRTFADWDDPAPGFVEADLVAPLRADGGWQLRADIDVNGHRVGLDGVRAAARTRASAANRSAGRGPQANAVSSARGSTRTMTACS